MKAIGFDPGFGGTKAATITPADELKTVAIPSVVGVGSTDLGLLDEMADATTGRKARAAVPDRVTFKNVTYLVGEGVSAYTRPVERMDFMRLSGGAELQALFYSTLYRLLGPGEHRALAIMVGLPVEVMQNKELASKTQEELRDWVVRRGEHRFKVNDTDVLLEVSALYVMAQPAGAYVHWSAANNGSQTRSDEELKASIAIADVGFNTLDLFGVQGGRVAARYTAGDTAGMRRASELLITTVRREYEITLSLHEADALIRSRRPELYTAAGVVDLRAVTEQARDAVASAVISLVERHWGNGRQFRYVLFTGGGSEALRQALTRQYPYGVVLPDAVTANAAGMAKALRRKLGKDGHG